MKARDLKRPEFAELEKLARNLFQQGMVRDDILALCDVAISAAEEDYLGYMTAITEWERINDGSDVHGD